MLPETYLSPVHLPFNSKPMQADLELLPPDRDPGGEGVWLLVSGGDVALAGEPETLTLPAGDLPASLAGEPSLYMGQWQGAPCRVMSVNDPEALPAVHAWHGLTSPVPQIPIDLLSLGGLGRQVLYWHANSRFCSRCGAAQDWIPGEWGKACAGCRAHHYPHIHPCVIVIVRRAKEILLTRKAEWPEGRYSLVAGFLDMGECLEEAVAREVKEETGVDVANIRYIGSQSWPFPSQLMCGFVADYAGGELRVEEEELEDVRWFPVDDLPILPPKRSISRYLIDNYKEKD